MSLGFAISEIGAKGSSIQRQQKDQLLGTAKIQKGIECTDQRTISSRLSMKFQLGW